MLENPTRRVTWRGYETESDTNNNPSSNREYLRGKWNRLKSNLPKEAKEGGNEPLVGGQTEGP